MFTPEEKRELVAIARKAIGDALHGRSSEVQIPPEGAPVPNSSERGSSFSEGKGRLSRPGGAFVTLRIDGNLRGCIGYIQAPVPLAEVVAEVAEKAALEDPRFSPLSLQEFERTHIEISVLSPLQRISSVNEIVVGKHGLLLELRHARGLLLPQVAEEYGWDREMFLENTARKAGLSRNAWKDPEAVIYIFTAEIIQEEVLAARRDGA
jgi:AmmeMemoRadiSam system protein A